MTINRPGFGEGSSPQLMAISLLQAADDTSSYPPVGISDYVNEVLRRDDAAEVITYLCAYAGVIARIAYDPGTGGPPPAALYTEVAEIIRRETARRQ
jgi:hypothetical protein